MRTAMVVLLLLVVAAAAGCREAPRSSARPAVADASPTLAPSPPPSNYDVRLAMSPTAPARGREVNITVDILTPEGSTPRLDDIGGSVVHLMAVNRDLSWYRHVHPRFEKGAHLAKMIFPKNGEYVLHTIFKPVDQEQQVRSQIVAVGGLTRRHEAGRLALSPEDKTSGNYTVSLRTKPMPAAVGKWNSLIFHVTQQGKPVTNLTPTGTLGHMAILAEGGENFVYSHSTDGEALAGVRGRMHIPAAPPGIDPSHKHGGDTGPDVTFHTRFPKSGRYKMWVEFNAGGDAINADFVVEVASPQPSTPID